MKHVLLPTDFSSNSQRAIRYALNVYGDQAKYTVLHTFEVPLSGGTMLISIADVLAKESQLKLDELLHVLNREFPNLKENIHTISDMGVPESSIKRLSEVTDYDIIIMGTKGASGIKEVLIGSVASNVMQSVKCPVLAVPESAPLSAPKKVLFAADDEILNAGVFPLELASLVRKFDAELMVLNVVPEGEIDTVGTPDAEERIPSSVFDGVRHSFHFVADNDVNGAITQFAKDNGVDLIGMVTRRNDFFGKLFSLSATKKMMQHVDLPLIAFH